MSLSEALTAQFYAWERRGRGWQVWDYPVVPEPQFAPFLRTLPSTFPVMDDARIPGPIGRLATTFRTLFTRSLPLESEQEVHAEEDEDSPLSDEADEDLVEITVRVPQEENISPELAERMLLALAGASAPVSFELLGHSAERRLVVACRKGDVSHVRETLEAFVSEATLEESSNLLAQALQAEPYAEVVDFGLSKEFMLPLHTPRSFAVDPLITFLGALGGLKGGEVGLVQVLFMKTSYPWAESMIRAITDGEGGAFFLDARETVGLTAEKVCRPLFAVVVRVASSAGTEERALQIARTLGNGLGQFSDPRSNEFIPLSNDDYPRSLHIEDCIARRTHRSGMILSSQELASFVHLPSASVRADSLRTIKKKTKAAPAAYTKGDVTLGENVHKGETQVVRLAHILRHRHLHIIGATGSGKSTLLLGLMQEDIAAGRGFALLDPHGDLADAVLESIPESRNSDVVVFDPSDEVAPVGLNVLHGTTERERELLASDMVAVFRRFSTSWGDQMTAVLGNAVLAFLEHPEGGTLLELRRFLVDLRYRERFLESVSDPLVRTFWRDEFRLLAGKPQASIVTRLDQFLRPKAIRRVVAQKTSRLDLGRLMNHGMIFVGKLSQGAIGEENAYLLGSLLVAKFEQATLNRESIPEAERRDFFLYIDEFHNFITPSLISLLSGARKYRVALTLAHHNLRQLRDPEVESAVLTNAATRVCFRLGDDDSRKLAQGFSSFDATDLQSLGIGEAVVRIERADHDFNLRVRLPPVGLENEGEAEASRESVKALSRARWGTPREVIERELQEVYGEVFKKPAEERAPATRGGEAVSSAQRSLPVPPQLGTLAPIKELETRVESLAPAAKRRSLVSRDPGRGGPKHKYLQSLVKHYGEERGFRASLEATLSNGGRVDVLLERQDQAIACEISITSTLEQERENVTKCLLAGYRRVVVVSPDRRRLKRLVSALDQSLNEEQRSLVTCSTPEEFLAYLDESRPPGVQEDTVLGYRVRTEIRAPDPKELAERRDRIARTIVRSLGKSEWNE